MKLFERFDKVFCINLDKRTDRLENFNKQVKKYDLGEYERISAIDGSQINRLNFTKTLSSGELGLVLTNLKILQNARIQNYEKILILEDDCIFEDEIINVDSYFEKLPRDWDMLYMGGNHNTHMGIPPPSIINDKISKLHMTYSTHLIGIKNTVYNKIINLLLEYKNPLDVCYVSIQKQNSVYSFYPAIAKQLVDYSNIQNTITDYNWLIK